jgi:hypothetical protein
MSGFSSSILLILFALHVDMRVQYVSHTMCRLACYEHMWMHATCSVDDQQSPEETRTESLPCWFYVESSCISCPRCMYNVLINMTSHMPAWLRDEPRTGSSAPTMLDAVDAATCAFGSACGDSAAWHAHPAGTRARRRVPGTMFPAATHPAFRLPGHVNGARPHRCCCSPLGVGYANGY